MLGQQGLEVQSVGAQLAGLRQRVARLRAAALPVRAAAPQPQPPAPGSIITSTNNAYVKHCVKLRSSRSYRQEAGSVVLVGRTVLEEVLGGVGESGRGDAGAGSGARSGVTARVLFALEAVDLPDVRAESVVLVSEPVMRKLSGLQSVEGGGSTAAEVLVPRAADFVGGWAPGALQRLLVLEGVQDPGNLGTLLRTALALGWHGAYLLPGCVDPFNDKALRSSRGAAFKLPIASGGWQELQEIAGVHGLACVAADAHAAAAPPAGLLRLSPDDNAAPASALPRVALVLGSEGQGLSSETLSRCAALEIPMAGDMESLNVSAAGSILMFALSESMPRLLQQLK